MLEFLYQCETPRIPSMLLEGGGGGEAGGFEYGTCEMGGETGRGPMNQTDIRDIPARPPIRLAARPQISW